MATIMKKGILESGTKEMMVTNMNGHITLMDQKLYAVTTMEDNLKSKVVLRSSVLVLMGKLIN